MKIICIETITVIEFTNTESTGDVIWLVLILLQHMSHIR